MAGFLISLVNGLRFSFGAKQVCSDIQQLSPAQSARLALLIALFRTKIHDVPVPGGSFTVCEIIQHPAAYRPELCHAAFNLLKEMRQATRDEMKSYSSFGVSPTVTLREHTEISDLALSLLMSTVAVGCRASTLDTVRYSWDYVSTFPPVESDIVELMKMPEYIVNDIIEQPLETEEWLEKARAHPEFLKPTP